MLVTHQLQYLHDVDHIVVMSGGQIKAQGSYDHIIQLDSGLIYMNENLIDATAVDNNQADDKVRI